MNAKNIHYIMTAIVKKQFENDSPTLKEKNIREKNFEHLMKKWMEKNS